MEFDSRAANALEIFENNGYTAYFVGGCVRDRLSGKTPTDYDIAAPCRPDVVKKIFCDFPQILTGEAYGTVTVVIDNLPLEITAFRSEGDYDDNRHPGRVNFGCDILTDLSRRDFTVNAIACDKNMRLYDPFFGIDDIKAGIIRSVGEPGKRFNEDALRILRAARFCATLGFEIEQNTAAAMLALKDSLSSISPERTATEIKKAAHGKNFAGSLNEYAEIFCAAYGGFEGFDTKAAKITQNADKNIKDYAFLCGFADTVAAAKGLFYGKQTAAVCGFLQDNLHKKQEDVRAVLKTVEYDTFSLLLALKEAYGINCDGEKAQYQNIINNRLCCKISELAVNGNDIKGLGYKDSAVGEMLNTALRLVTNEGVENDRQAILDRLKNM